MTRMPFTIFAVLLAVAIASAEDLTTRTGTTYTDVEIRRVEPDGITIKHSAGLIKIHARELSDEDRDRFHFTPEAARAYAQQQREAYARQEAARRLKAAEEELAKTLQEHAREYTLYCLRSDKNGVKCYDHNYVDYIIRDYEAMPSTWFRVYAAPLPRRKLSSVESAIELIPVKRPPPSPSKP